MRPEDLVIGELMDINTCAKNKEQCYQINILPIMDEIKNLGKQINDFKLEIVKEIASMPEKILDKSDTKYASKSIEDEVKNLTDKLDARAYDWLKILVTAILTLGVSYLLFKLTH